MDWQPISTAPRDGTPVLLYKPAGRWDGGYMRAGYWGEYLDRGEQWIACGGFAIGYRSSETDTPKGWPTHWQPLPSPPGGG